MGEWILLCALVVTICSIALTVPVISFLSQDNWKFWQVIYAQESDQSDLDSFLEKTEVSIHEKDAIKLTGANYFEAKTSQPTAKLEDFTISLWIKPDYSGGSPQSTIISKELAFLLSLKNNIPTKNTVSYSVFDGIKWHTIESSSVLADSKWSHVAVYFGDSEISLFINGKLESSKKIDNVPVLSEFGELEESSLESISSDAKIVLGTYLYKKEGIFKAKNHYSGLVSSMALYNTAISESQIEGVYEGDKPSENIVAGFKEYSVLRPEEELDDKESEKETQATTVLQSSSKNEKVTLEDSLGVSEVVEFTHGTAVTTSSTTQSGGILEFSSSTIVAASSTTG